MPTPGFTSYSVDNDRLFREAMNKARRLTGDLRIPLTLISRDFFRSQKAIWQLKGHGQYPDLAARTKADKTRKGYSVYPILKRTGRLEDAASKPGALGNVNQLVGKTDLIMGVESGTIPYALFHQEGRGVPMRKFMFIGPEAKKFANSDQVGRLNRWTNIFYGYVLEAVQPIGKAA